MINAIPSQRKTNAPIPQRRPDPIPILTRQPKPTRPTMGKDVSIGAESYYHPNVRFITYNVPGERIIVGKYCSIAEDVIINAGGEHPVNLPSTWPFENKILVRQNPTRSYMVSKPTIVGNDVWIGHGGYINGGSTIGDGAVIGAKAVVFGDVPPYAIIMGNPGKVVRFRFSQTIVEKMLRIAWWNWPSHVVRDRIEWFYRPIQEFVLEFYPEGMATG